MILDIISLKKELTKDINPLAQIRNDRKYCFNNFKAKVPVFVETSKYIVKTAENCDELKKAFDLRFEVFYKEVMGKKVAQGQDTDKFDTLFDHIIILDKSTGECAGTYRVNSSTFSNKFSCEHEFDIKKFLKLNGNKLEIGRACISKNYRNGTTLMILWKGIIEYAKKTNTKYMFGCSSIYTTDVFSIIDVFNAGFIYKHLKQNYEFEIDCDIKPHGKYKLKKLDSFLNYLDNNMLAQCAVETEIMIPPLLKFYLKTGAKIAGEPAHDKFFNCVDFFTIIDLEKADKLRGKKYGL